jgi:glycosyltransferase involved in cell wall biosynthesis
MPPARPANRLRLRVLVPRGALPAWLGKTLRGLESAGSIQLQLLVVESAPGSRREPVPWVPDSADRACLTRWQAGAAGTCDAVLAFDPRLFPLQAEPGLGPQPLEWLLCGASGESLWRRDPLLVPITAGAGVRLHCLQRESSTGDWQAGRTLHVPANSRYGAGLATTVLSLQRLVQLSVADRQVQSNAAGVRSSVEAAAFEWQDASREPGAAVSAWYRLGGRWRAWVGQQRLRWASEYWRIGVIDAPIDDLIAGTVNRPVRWITEDSLGGYWADPFGLPDDPTRLACEFFDEKTGVGRLETLELGADDRIVSRVPIEVGTGRHVSFPSIFEIEGRRYGLAETVSARECVLHEVGVDGSWQPLFPLLRGVAAADPALFRHEGRYWLAYTDADLGERDNLCLHHAERLEGPWQPHANNPVKVDVTCARMAGPLFTHGGALYRPAQDCLKTYGAAVVVHRVLALTPQVFDEVEVRRLWPDPSGACPDGLHTLAAWGGRTLVDGKRHGINLVTLRRKLRRARALRRGAVAARVDSGALLAQRELRVFVYVPHLRMGGGETSMLRLARGLAQTGLTVDLVVHTLGTSELPLPEGVNVISLDCEGTAAAVRKLAGALRKHRPRWLLSAFPHTNVAAVLARALSGADTRCIVTEHAPLSQQIAQHGGWRYRLLPPLLRWAYRRADAVVAVSDGVRDDLQVVAGLAAPPVVIRNPVLAPDFAAELERAPDHLWLLAPELEVVLSVCRLGAEKDLPTLLRAFAEVHRSRPAARLLLAGEGPERARLEALVAELDLGDVVQLPGRTDQPLRWMRRAAVFVLASRFEGFGNVLVEALACGTPVVSTDCPVGPREVLEGGRWGTLVPVGDAAAMAAAITRTLADRQLPEGASEAARQFTEARASDAYRRLFDSLLPSTAARC